MKEFGFPKIKNDAKGKPNDVAYQSTGAGGWSGITDKYWLTALIPDQSLPTTVNYRYIPGGDGHYQVDYVSQDPQTVAPGATATTQIRLFAGAKVVDLVDRYRTEYHIPQFDKAIDWG